MSEASSDDAILADVLAFLDEFEADESLSPTQFLPAQQHTHPEKLNYKPVQPWIRATKQEKNKTRLELYRMKKQELQSLRAQVEDLTRQLDLLKHRSTNGLQAIASTSLCITVKRFDWGVIAERERKLRLKSELLNEHLRRQVKLQQKLSSDVGAQLQLCECRGAEGLQESVRLFHSNPESPKLSYCSLLHRVLDKIHEILELDPLCPLKDLHSARSASHSSPSNAWSTSFHVPIANPDTVGLAWWQAIQISDSLQGVRTDEASIQHQNQREIVKKAVWSVGVGTPDEIRFIGLITFRLKIELGVSCVLSARGDVFDSTGTLLLFRTSVVRIVTPISSTVSPSCLLQAQYSVYNAGISEILQDCHDQAVRVRKQAEVGISTWREMMQLKDQHMRLRFLGL